MTNTYPHTDAVYTEAMDKLRDEMATSKSEGVQALGEGMTSWLREHPSEAGALLAEGKNLKGAFAAMEAYARGQKRASTCVVVTPAKAREIALEYYGISVKNEDEPREAAEHPVPYVSAGALDLDALLGGL